MKITATNESSIKFEYLFYEVDFTVGDKHGDDVPYFHACYRRENYTTLRKDYEILPKQLGRGRYLGCNIGVIADKKTYDVSWWGEGEVKIYLDGDTEFPTLCGTGTEDYIGTGWGQGRYDNMYQGCQYADMPKMEYCFYRYHVMDPVYFNKEIRVTIQQIGCWGPESKSFFSYNDTPVINAHTGKRQKFGPGIESTPYGYFERCDDWSSCAYFYLDSPVNNLPEIDPIEKRII